MSVKRVPVSTFVREFRREQNAERLTLLAGAGVSMVNPTALPSGHRLKDMAVAGLCSTTELRCALRRVRRSARYQSITPEVVFQRLYSRLGHSSLEPFFEVLRHADPNVFHRLIGDVARSPGVRLHTTNFDDLFERAGVPSSRIIHLHGDLTRPTKMIARINQVGTGADAAVLGLLQRDLRGRSIAFLGYSGNDQDIRLAIKRSGVTRVLWLTKGSRDWAWRNIAEYARSVRVLVSNAGFGGLARHLLGDRIPPRGPPSTIHIARRQRVVARWSTKARLVDKFACISEIFFEIEDYRGALAISREALRHAKGTELVGWFHIQIADALKILGRFDEAEDEVRKAIKFDNRLGDPYNIAGAYNNYGVLLVEKAEPEPRRAIPQLRHALDVLDSIDMRKGTRRRRESLVLLRGRVLNNLGLAYETAKDYPAALEFYESALETKEESGDLLGQAKTAGNVSILKIITGDPGAETWQQKALALMREFNLQRDSAYVLFRTGDLLCERGEAKRGRKFLREAHRAAIAVNDPLFLSKLIRASTKKWNVVL